MGKSVAVAADVTAEVGNGMVEPAKTGTWKAGAVQTEPHPRLRVGDEPVVHKATCTFSFAGKTASNPPVDIVGAEIVTLTATPTKLQHGNGGVLLDGDEAEGQYGNKLTVSAAGKLSSS